jgi:hypothetical protein
MLAALAPFLGALVLQAPAGPDVLVDIRVHGNVLTPADEVVRLAGLREGMPVAADLVDQTAARLRATGRFERVEVLKRFASIADPSQILIVIVVDEGPVRIERTGDPNAPVRVVKRRAPPLMFLPMLSFEDGYGLTYGVRLAVPDPVGRGSRLAFPLTWGGDRRAAAVLDLPLADGPVTRLEAGASIRQRTHPYYDSPDDRHGAWVRAERAIGDAVRAGIDASAEEITLLDREDRFARWGVDMTVDTRADPWLPGHAVYARVSWDRLDFREGDSAARTALDVRAYARPAGQAVLVARVQRQDSSRPLPPALRPMLGGMESVRGFRTGSDIGDTHVAGSIELRLPLTSPLNVGKLGVSAFFDAGAVYDEGERLGDQPFARGAGASVWLSAAIVHVNLAVAHGLDAGTRVHFGTTLEF